MGMETPQFHEIPEPAEEKTEVVSEEKETRVENRSEEIESPGRLSSLINKVREKLKSGDKWKKIEEFAEQNNLKLQPMSDREYIKQTNDPRPIPENGHLYRSGDTVYFTRERVSPEKVKEFIEKSKQNEIEGLEDKNVIYH